MSGNLPAKQWQFLPGHRRNMQASIILLLLDTFQQLLHPVGWTGCNICSNYSYGSLKLILNRGLFQFHHIHSIILFRWKLAFGMVSFVHFTCLTCDPCCSKVSTFHHVTKAKLNMELQFSKSCFFINFVGAIHQNRCNQTCVNDFRCLI